MAGKQYMPSRGRLVIPTCGRDTEFKYSGLFNPCNLDSTVLQAPNVAIVA